MNRSSNVTEYQIGGRLIPRSTVDRNLSKLFHALQTITEHGAVVSGVSLNVSRTPVPDNAVNPPWRDTAISIVIAM